MSLVKSPISDMLVTVKSREIQRGMLAEMRGDPIEAAPHLMAGGHLEIVLARDYERAGDDGLALRSRMSAAACFWRGGDIRLARRVLDDILRSHPEKADAVSEAIAELEQSFPNSDENRGTDTSQ